MCGGRGTRLGAVGEATEKPLVEVCGHAMVDRVLDALAGSRADRVHAVVSPQAPATREHLRERARAGDARDGDDSRNGGGSLAVVDAPGDGYVADLGYALERVDCPVLTVAADLPLLSAAVIDRVLAAAGERDGDPDASLAVYVPVELKRDLGVSVDSETATTVDGRAVAPTGLNLVGDDGSRDGDGRDDGYDDDSRDDGYDDGSRDGSLVLADERLAVNANRPRDLRVAEALSRRERGDGGPCTPDPTDTTTP